MRKVETDVANVDKKIKKQAQRVKKALRETVDLEGLNEKIMAKYLKFLQLQVSNALDGKIVLANS